jgi:transcriptional regulator with XRE-family HTH domain
MSETKPLTSKELKAWRMKRGLSQRALGKILGVSCDTVSEWENDISGANCVMLRLALRGLGRLSTPLEAAHLTVSPMTSEGLRSWRRQRGLRQMELAQLLGVKRQATISAWETDIDVTKPMILKFALLALGRMIPKLKIAA